MAPSWPGASTRRASSVTARSARPVPARRRSPAWPTPPRYPPDGSPATRSTPCPTSRGHSRAACRACRAEPVKLNETSGGWFYLTGLLGLDGGAGLVDPHLGGQGRGCRAPAAEPVRAGGEGVV